MFVKQTKEKDTFEVSLSKEEMEVLGFYCEEYEIMPDKLLLHVLTGVSSKAIRHHHGF